MAGTNRARPPALRLSWPSWRHPRAPLPATGGSGPGLIRSRRDHSCGICPGGQHGDREPGGPQSTAQFFADHLEGVGPGLRLKDPGLEPAYRIAQSVVGSTDLREFLRRTVRRKLPDQFQVAPADLRFVGRSRQAKLLVGIVHERVSTSWL